jgi:hypothetical protein
MPASQIQGQFTFLWDMVRSNLIFAVQMLHTSVCWNNQNLLDLLHSLAAGGSPSLLLQALLGENHYRASLSGDILSVFKCDIIHNYMFQPRTECQVEWPILFLHNHDQKEGFLIPLSHEMVDTATPTECPAGQFFFDSGSHVILLTYIYIYIGHGTIRSRDGYTLSSLGCLGEMRSIFVSSISFCEST